MFRMSDLLERNARSFPEMAATICDGRTTSWQELWDNCQSLAGGLDHLGLGPGDRIGFIGLNSDWFYTAYFAPSLIGGELIALNYRLAVPELVDCVEDCAARLLITDREFLDVARQVADMSTQDVTLIVIGDADLGVSEISYDDLLSQGHRPESTPSGGDDTLIIYYSGGTTGKPKGVMLSHWNLFANSSGLMFTYGYQMHETHLLVGPMFHIAAGSRVYNCAMMATTLVIQPKFTPEGFLQLIETHKVQVTLFVPTMMQMILDLPSFESYDVSSLEKMTFGASSTPEALLRRIITAFPHVELGHGYGMTEAAPFLTSLGPEYHRADFVERGKMGSAGRPAPHCDVRIFDENDQELPMGNIGEIVARGPNVMKGYVNLPAETARTLRGGWLHTGDCGYFDEDGCLWITGRLKDMIISGGENIYPVEIENVLSNHPSVSEVAVIGIPHKKWGEAVHAVIIAKPGTTVDEQEIKDYCAARLARYKCPQSITLRTDPMPLSAANKVLKTALRAPFWEQSG